MKERTKALNEKFSSILEGVRSYCKNATQKSESFDVINKESNL